MMGNKWIQAVLIGGIGFGMWLSCFIASIFGPLPLFFIGLVFMMISMYKTADCRDTDEWGGPWHGPND